ncbi:MAG: FHA domain-containing protein [Chloroflexi bacterium]|uniref:FHA domain-containing protein n=1 Tax=Candidatus Chlorohelix allophototropha TaxID=3003348 RepID=A0A8T7M499_9CHLR|nr:FHA domain-containing protein [Chloroflexota bacterium]WJW70097.1 FHA domain-containing protein [Chloroflexota bacterium L227-S17]
MAKFYRSMSADPAKIDPTVLGWLNDRLPDDCWVLVEFAVDTKNCDFAILADNKIAVLEVKSIKYPVKGSANSRWINLNNKKPLAISSSTGYSANPVGQAHKIADTLVGHLRQNISTIFGQDSKLRPERLKAFPFVVIPKPHPKNQIARDDDFCWIAEGQEQFFAAFQKLKWDAGISLTPLQKERIVKMLNLEYISNPEKLFSAGLPTPTSSGGEEELIPEQEALDGWVSLDYGNGVTEEYHLTDRITRIGRDRNNHIVVDDSQVSREHCQLEFRNGDYYLRDVGSKHGTTVKGRKLKKNELELVSNGTAIQLSSKGVKLILYSSGNV